MCSLYFCDIAHIYTYHTSEQNIQILGNMVLQIFSDLRYNEYMTILNNLENSWDSEFQFQSSAKPETDNMGRSTGAWKTGPAVYDSLTLKLFSEATSKECNCKHE